MNGARGRQRHPGPVASGYRSQVIRRVPAPSPWVAVGAGLITVGALFCPWARSGTVDRSSIELLGSASALDLFGDVERAAVVVGWFLVVVLVAGMLVAAAWGRPSLGALLALPIGPAMALA